ncbi:MAG: hypothetical protein A2Z72_02915 [Omnitrophica bacterium RBG_13_46_9]|nr:MAG: hypothetical protein A2Z72_02915 [Omnitrophica bacterium RBG_13_46_9]
MEDRDKVKCDVIIPVCNMFAYTRLCLEKLIENTLVPFDLIIIDNGSTDRTGEFFSGFAASAVSRSQIIQRLSFGSAICARETEAQRCNADSPEVRIEYIKNEKNVGPIFAYNQGIRIGRSKYVCMMHNDVLIFERGWLGKILDVMESDRDIGIVGLAGRKRINKKGLVDELSLVHNLQNEHLNVPMRSHSEDVAVIDGLCFIARRKILERTGGLNEDYTYMHCYDLDISMASRDLGYRNVVVNVEAMHVSNGGVTRRAKDYKALVRDDYKLLNVNYKKFREKWKRLLPVAVD